MQRTGLDLDALADDEADLQLAGAPALADHEVAQRADLRAAVVGAVALLARPGQHGAPRLVAALALQQAVLDVDDVLPRAGRVEATDELAGVAVGAEGELELVAVAPLLDRADDRQHREAVEVAEAAERVLDLLGLDRELLLVG